MSELRSIISPIVYVRNQSSERLRSLPKVTQLVSYAARIWTQAICLLGRDFKSCVVRGRVSRLKDCSNPRRLCCSPETLAWHSRPLRMGWQARCSPSPPPTMSHYGSSPGTSSAGQHVLFALPSRRFLVSVWKVYPLEPLRSSSHAYRPSQAGPFLSFFFFFPQYDFHQIVL